MASYPNPSAPPFYPHPDSGYSGTTRGGFTGRGRGRGGAVDSNGKKLVKKMNDSEAEKFVAKWLSDHKRIPMSFSGNKGSSGLINDIRRYVGQSDLQKLAYQVVDGLLSVSGRVTYEPGSGIQKPVVGVVLKVTPTSSLGSVLFDKYLTQAARNDAAVLESARIAMAESAKKEDTTAIKSWHDAEVPVVGASASAVSVPPPKTAGVGAKPKTTSDGKQHINVSKSSEGSGTSTHMTASSTDTSHVK